MRLPAIDFPTLKQWRFSSETSRLLLIIASLLMTIVLANRFFYTHDMTANSRHTLLDQSVQTLDLFNGPIDVEVFINPLDQQRNAVEELLERYRDKKTDISISFTDPALNPSRMRELNIAPGGEVFFTHGKNTRRIAQVSELAVTSALQRLARGNQRIAYFVTGHGERAPESRNNADLGIFANQLRDSGVQIKSVNLTSVDQLDDDGLLVIASPIQRYLPLETAKLLDYISRGGKLLWLSEPASADGLKALELELGIRRLPGVVIDMAAQQLQVERPDFAITDSYSPHVATQGFTSVTLFPQASGMDLEPNREWRATAMVQTGKQAWTETGSLTGEIAFGDDSREIAGPFPLILALERQRRSAEQSGSQSTITQKVIVSGDGDFLADAWLGNGGNRDLGNRLFNWILDDTDMIGIEQPSPVDARLHLTSFGIVALSAIALFLLPAIFISGATRVWYQRHHG